MHLRHRSAQDGTISVIQSMTHIDAQIFYGPGKYLGIGGPLQGVGSAVSAAFLRANRPSLICGASSMVRTLLKVTRRYLEVAAR
jgi:hypothetical protein